MSTDPQRDADLDRLLRAQLRRESAGAAGACPDAGMLAAFVEGDVAGDERAALEAHLASCGRCQETLAAMDLEVPASAPAATEPAVSRRPWLWRGHLHWLIPVGAATALVIYVASRPAIAPSNPEIGRDHIEVAELRPTTPPSVALPSAARPAAPASAPARAARDEGAPPASSKGERATAPVIVTTPVPARVDAAKRETEPAALPRQVAVAAPPLAAPQAAKVAPPPPAPAMAAEAVPAQAQAMAADAAAQRNAAPGAAGEIVAGGQPRAASAERALRTAATDLVEVSAPGGTIQWRVGPGGAIWRSADEGRTWFPQRSGVRADLLAVSAPSVTTCWAAGAAGTVLLTDDGERWERRPFPEKADLVAVDARSAHEASVTTRDGRRFATSDRGATWTLQR